MAQREEMISAFKKGGDFWEKWRSLNQNAILNFSNSDLHGTKLNFRMDLSYANFRNCDLSNCLLEGANLRNTDFSYGNLEKASLRKSDCTNAKFINANLRKCNFHRAHLDDANFTNADLQWSDFSITNGTNLILTNSKINNIKIAPDIPYINFLDSTDFFALIYSKGLEDVHINSQKFALEYIKLVFNEIHNSPPNNLNNNEKYLKSQWNQVMSEKYFDEITHRINSLYRLFNDRNSPKEFYEISKHLDSQILELLKKDPRELHNIHWRIFEELIAEILSSYGWHIDLTKQTRDGGYDIFAIYKDSHGARQSCIIECKKWNPQRKVGIEVVRSLYGVKTDLGVGKALLATTSFFTKGVYDFKSSHFDFDLKDFNGIIDWLNEYHLSEAGKLYIKNNRLKYVS